MNSIEQQALKTFQENLVYFSKEHPKVYKNVDMLSQAIADGTYKERYSLEYKNDYFDILDIVSNNYLYNENSLEHAKKLTKKVNYKKSDGAIETFYKQNITQEQVDYYDQKVPITDHLYATAKIINYVNKVTSSADEMKVINKFIFSGIGLGFHLSKIQNKIDASYLFIIENNLELFRLSLFTTNYSTLSEGTNLFFSIMEDDLDFKESFTLFFTQAYNYNQYIKYITLSNNYINNIKKVQNYVVTAQYLTFPYSSHLKELLKAPEYLIQNYPFINLSNTLTDSFLSHKKVLLVASGPSLGTNIEWLVKNHNKFIIISVLSSLKTLYKHNIKPHIVVNIDASINSPRLLEGIDIKNFLDETIVILSSVVTRKLIDSFEQKNVYCFESASSYKQNFGGVTAPSVGETTYAISLLLGVSKLYLLGLDLALDSETLRSHSKEHHDSRELQKNITPEDEQQIELHKSVIYHKGNFVDSVPVLPVYKLSINVFNQFSQTYLKNTTKVYNLNNGAFLNGTIPLHIKNIDTSLFDTLVHKDIFTQLRILLQSTAQSQVNKDDIKNIKAQIQEAQRLYEYVQEFQATTSTSNYSLYMQKFYTLSSEAVNLASDTKYDINIVLYTYLHYISGYIFDIFNTKGLKNQKRHLKKIHAIFTEQLLKILDLYLTTMNVYREFAEVKE